MVTACAGLFSSLLEAAADISVAARHVNSIMRNEWLSISSRARCSHGEDEKETGRNDGGNQRAIIRGALTFDWTSQASADREVPNLIY